MCIHFMTEGCVLCPFFLHRCPLIWFTMHRWTNIRPDNKPVCLPILSAPHGTTLFKQIQNHHRQKYPMDPKARVKLSEVKDGPGVSTDEMFD